MVWNGLNLMLFNVSSLYVKVCGTLLCEPKVVLRLLVLPAFWGCGEGFGKPNGHLGAFVRATNVLQTPSLLVSRLGL
jgi:hypothetical protein